MTAFVILVNITTHTRLVAVQCATNRRRSQGVHHQGGEKIGGGANLQGKVVSEPPGRACTPKPELTMGHIL